MITYPYCRLISDNWRSTLKYLILSSSNLKYKNGFDLVYKGKRIAVVVPAYNEEELILDTLRGMPDIVDRIYAINDGSADRTYELMVERSKVDHRIVPIDHGENKGVGAALITGYKASVKDGMDITAIMAGDDQMDPRYLPSLLDPIVDGNADYSKGNRLVNTDYVRGMSTWRFFGNTILTMLTKLSSGHYNIGDPQNGYTAMNNEVFKTIDPDSIFPWYGYCNDILMRLKVHGFKVEDVAIPARYGKEKSTIPYPKYIARLSRLLLVNFFLRLGMKKAVRNPNIPSYSSIAGSVLVFGGVMMSATTPIRVQLSQTDLTNGLISIGLGLGFVMIFYGIIINQISKTFIVTRQND